MPSPFPGMNPYLEQDDFWQDFHNSMIPAIRDAIAPQVSPEFLVKIEQQVFIHEPPADYRILAGRSDVSLARPNGVHESSVATAMIASPIIARLPTVEFEKHLLIEIRDRKSRDLITVIEILSPTNKRNGPDREQYLAKRANLLRSTAHFIEIDLLRGWEKMPIENARACDYCIMVSRVEDRPAVNYWPLNLRDRLPLIPVPLRFPHANAEIDLKAVIDGIYDRAEYRHHIYKETPYPPLSPEDAAWAASLIAS